ncbi:Uncharacterised protein [Mycobacterium tuberculosis]|nr:Uncharacterised protein [Mycobacterium tuberculosis]
MIIFHGLSVKTEWVLKTKHGLSMKMELSMTCIVLNFMKNI